MNNLSNLKKTPSDEEIIEGIEKLAFYHQTRCEVEVIEFEAARKGILINFKNRSSYNIRVDNVYFSFPKSGDPVTKVAMKYLKQDRRCFSGELEGIIIGENRDIFYASNVNWIRLKPVID